MLFNSLEFFLFFFIVVLSYFSLPHRWRWLVLLVASYYFIISAKPEYALIVAAATLLNYAAGRYIGATRNKRARQSALWAILVIDIATLFAFKYFNFFSESARTLLQGFGLTYEPYVLTLLLPLGISFYTFQNMSYVIDVYNKRIKPERHLGIFATYISFFPKFISGPIERAGDLTHQFAEKHRFDIDNTTDGIKLFLWGLFKKMVVADSLAAVVNMVYGHPTDYTGLALIVATVFFAFQLYYDFSGYTDMAIGLAQILGFRLTNNFRRPYLSKSIAEFWRRWHITLSSWFRDYLYFPLGGSRVSVPRWCFNTLIVFIVCGLWHGANWTFVIWGGIQAVYMIISRLTLSVRQRFWAVVHVVRFPRIYAAWQVLFTFALTSIGWIFFRANSLHEAMYILTHLLDIHLDFTAINIGMNWAGIILAILFIAIIELIELAQEHEVLTKWWSRSVLAQAAAYLLLIVIILVFGVFHNAQFIYAQF